MSEYSSLHDSACLEIIEQNPNMLIPWFLMAQYLYYYRDEIILTDATFDLVSRRMRNEWNNLFHIHKPIAAEYVENGKPQLGRFEYPAMIRGAACALAGINMDFDEQPIIEKKKTEKPQKKEEGGGIFDFF